MSSKVVISNETIFYRYSDKVGFNNSEISDHDHEIFGLLLELSYQGSS